MQKMRKMKDSGIEWIGEIPEGWEIIPVKYLAKYNYDTLAESCSPDFEFSYIDIGSVTYTDGITNYQNFKFKDAPSRARRIVHSGDILVSTVRTYLRAVACVNEHRLPQIASTGFLVLQADISKIHPHFLMYSVLSDNFICKVEANSVGISYPAINASQIVHFKLPIPQLSEQFLLVTYLDRQCSEIDALLSKTLSSIEEYKKLKQAVITQAVTKGVRGEREMKDSGVEWASDIPVDWNTIKLKYCTYIRARLGWRALKADEYVESGFPFLSAFNIVNNALHFTNLNYINQFRYDESPEIQLKVGDVLLVKDGAGIGKCAIVENMPIPSTVNGSIAVISSTSFIIPKYLYYYFLSEMFQRHIDLLKDGMGVPHLFQSDLKEIKIAFPSKDEQKEIADYLDAKCAEIDRLIAKKEQLAKELESYKKSLIYEVVTGKREV